MAKSTILTDTSTEWDSVPDVAVTVTVNVEAMEEETVKVDMPDPTWDIVTVAGFNVAVNPGADTIAANDNVPEKPLTPLSEIVESEEDPTSATMKDWAEEIVKSTTLTETVVE